MKDVPSLVKAEGEMLCNLARIDCNIKIVNDFKNESDNIVNSRQKEVEYDETAINLSKPYNYSISNIWDKARKLFYHCYDKIKSVKKFLDNRKPEYIVSIQSETKIKVYYKLLIEFKWHYYNW